MRILALEPYYGGSHKAFLDGWSKHSRHDWTILGMRAYKWKWRMRHAALSFAEQLRERDDPWDMVFCSDMLDLATFRGLAPERIRSLYSVTKDLRRDTARPTQTQGSR